MNVSPMKTSKKGYPYFNANIQMENKITNVVGFNEKRQKELKLLEEQLSENIYFFVVIYTYSVFFKFALRRMSVKLIKFRLLLSK